MQKLTSIYYHIDEAFKDGIITAKMKRVLKNDIKIILQNDTRLKEAISDKPIFKLNDDKTLDNVSIRFNGDDSMSVKIVLKHYEMNIIKSPFKILNPEGMFLRRYFIYKNDVEIADGYYNKLDYNGLRKFIKRLLAFTINDKLRNIFKMNKELFECSTCKKEFKASEVTFVKTILVPSKGLKSIYVCDKCLKRKKE